MELTSGQKEVLERRKSKEIIIEDKSVCHFCKSTGLNESDKFCPICRFPQGGSQGEMDFYLHRMKNKRNLLEKTNKKVSWGRNLLFILAGLNFVIGLFLFTVRGYSFADFLASLIAASIYLGLGLWSRRKPFAAILSGFFFYIVIIALSGVIDPTTLYKGIILKIIIISGFIYGYKSVKEAEVLQKDLRLNIDPVDLKK